MLHPRAAGTRMGEVGDLRAFLNHMLRRFLTVPGIPGTFVLIKPLP